MVGILCPGYGFNRCPWKPVGGELQHAIEWWLWLGSTNHRLCWIHDIGIVLRCPSPLVPWKRDIVLGQFWKLGFCSVRECEILAHRGQIWKFLDHEHVARITKWNLPKISCMTHRNPFLMHGWNFMPRVGIQEVSLKVCRSWDSTCIRMMSMAHISMFY